MTATVIKKDGTKEEFIPEKIITSTIKAGASAKRARKIAKAIEEKFKDEEKIRSSEIRGEVIKEINKERGIIEETDPENAIKEVKEVVERLEKRASWDSREILLRSFDSTDRFNDFSKEISLYDNVHIKDVNKLGEELIAEIIVLPPNRSVH